MVSEVPGVRTVQAGGHVLKGTAVGAVQVHADLLVDDAHFLFHAFCSEVGDGHKLQEDAQTLFKIMGAGKIIGGDVEAGERIDRCAQGRQFCGNVPALRHIEHLVLQEMGHAGGDGVFLSLQLKFRMDGAEIRNEIGQLLGKAGAGDHLHRQSIGQDGLVNGFTQAGIFNLLHGCPP